MASIDIPAVDVQLYEAAMAEYAKNIGKVKFELQPSTLDSSKYHLKIRGLRSGQHLNDFWRIQRKISLEHFHFQKLLADSDLDCFTVVVMARRDLEKGLIKEAMARLLVDADKLRHHPELYEIVATCPCI